MTSFSEGTLTTEGSGCLRSSIRLATTVDYFQSREADIVIAVMGTNSSPGPGFTRDAHRLNVMLTRQRHDLAVMGDATIMPVRRGAR